MLVSYTHWLPVVTRCPVNGLPDALFLWVSLDVPDDNTNTPELYALRKRCFGGFFMKKMFMEDVALEVFQRAKEAYGDQLRTVELRLMFNKHHILVLG